MRSLIKAGREIAIRFQVRMRSVFTPLIAVVALGLSSGIASAQSTPAEDAYLSARKCFTALNAAWVEGRWDEIDAASKTWAMAAEAWHVAYGAGRHGHSGICEQYYKPEYGLLAFGDRTLIQAVPNEEVRTAYLRDTDELVNLAFLSRWVWRPDFPTDMIETARQKAMAGLRLYRPDDRFARLTPQMRLGALILRDLSAKGDGHATYYLSVKKFDGYSLQKAANQGYGPAQNMVGNQTGSSTGQIMNNMVHDWMYCLDHPTEQKCSNKCANDPDNWDCQDRSVNWNKR